MPRRHRHALTCLSVSVAGALLVGVPAPAHAGGHAAVSRPRIDPVPEVPVPASGSAGVPLEPSPASRPVPERPVGPEPPPVTTPAGPTLVNGIVADAERRLAAEGAGRTAPAVRKLLPAADQASILEVSRPAARALGRIKELAGVSKGVPLLTYRLCAESAGRPASCSAPQPPATPVQADVTGDGTADVLASLVPQKVKGSDAVGVGLASARLPGSETHDGPLKAQVWAQYDIPGKDGEVRRLSVGFDGYRRGSSLSGLDWGVFTVDLAAQAAGVVDVRADVRRSDPGASAAVVAGLDGETLISLRQAPAAARFTARARSDGERSRLGVTSSAPAELDALVVTDRRRFTRMLADEMRTRLSMELTRSGGVADVHFTSPAPIGRAQFHDYVYRDGLLAKAAGLSITRLPSDFRARYASAAGTQALTVTSGAPRAEAADVLYFDRAADRTVVQAALTGLPARVRLVNDLAAHRVTHTASSAIGGLEVILQRNEGAISTPRGGHVTMIKDGGRLGVSGRLSQVAGADVTYGGVPRIRLELGPSGRPFLGAASIDRTHLVRLELSNTPARIRAELDPGAGRAEYGASGVIDRLRAAYAHTRTGPTVDGSLYGLRSTVRASWRLGERTAVDVATTSNLKKVGLYAARSYLTRVGPAGGEDVQAAVEGVRGHVTAVVDTRDSRLDWTADRPVASVTAVARAGVQGRAFRLAASATGVPARFDASWAARTPRFRGLSGPIGSAAIAVTNHAGARAPAGPHLAAHYVEATGDFDASVRIDGLKHAEFTPTGSGFKADVRAARQTVALDADIRPAGDLRFGVLGRLGPVPGGIAVSAAAGGPVTYDAGGRRLDLRAQVWLGKAAALDAIKAVPHVPGGLSLVDAGCDGCGTGQGPFCTAERGCFGLKGSVDVTGLPSKVTVDPARQTFAFTGYRPASGRLGLYLDSTVLAPAPVRALATLTGLPRSITRMSVGPFGIARGKDDEGRDTGVVTANYRLEPAATVGSLEVLAETDAGGGYGRVRGQVALDPVPAAVAVSGAYGRRTRIRVHNSTPVRRLQAKVTALGGDRGPGTGLLRFTDVPAVFGIDADAADTGLQLPAFTYKAGAGTLDGLFAVEGALIERVYRPREGELLDTSFAVEDLAADTTAKVNPDLSVELVSRPAPTRLLEVHTGLSLAPVAAQRVSARKDVPRTGGFLAYRLGGEFGLGRSRIGDLSLTVHRMSWLRIRPGRIPFGIAAPKALGYLTPGFEGGYDRLDLRADGVDLRPDVKLNVKVSRSVGADVFNQDVRLGPVRSLAFRHYDQRMRPIGGRQTIKAADLPLACVTVGTRPGLVSARARDSITLRGAAGPQMVSLLDQGGQVPGYAVDLLSHFMSPFPGADWKISAVDPGRC
ncbi:MULTISPECIES: hypothetical protein [Streptosporangium]|uniref:Uncharacterized protein n=1 Tax=Streptosporangium brasiliense TaxID=47480 RepID=A0ABT9REL2_9ACTN|nr:hypothetical protein [Streptosporangium brasiliense]MDP9867154.1 hypothetical protein [Streptosporangium brasiliense]